MKNKIINNTVAIDNFITIYSKENEEEYLLKELTIIFSNNKANLIFSDFPNKFDEDDDYLFPIDKDVSKSIIDSLSEYFNIKMSEINIKYKSDYNMLESNNIGEDVYSMILITNNIKFIGSLIQEHIEKGFTSLNKFLLSYLIIKNRNVSINRSDALNIVNILYNYIFFCQLTLDEVNLILAKEVFLNLEYDSKIYDLSFESVEGSLNAILYARGTLGSQKSVLNNYHIYLLSVFIKLYNNSNYNISFNYDTNIFKLEYLNDFQIWENIEIVNKNIWRDDSPTPLIDLIKTYLKRELT